MSIIFIPINHSEGQYEAGGLSLCICVLFKLFSLFLLLRQIKYEYNWERTLLNGIATFFYYFL